MGARPGGLPAIAAANTRKGEILYGAIDAQSEFYRCPVEVGSRSVMNVVFRLAFGGGRKEKTG